jgi:hypothetical protein
MGGRDWIFENPQHPYSPEADGRRAGGHPSRPLRAYVEKADDLPSRMDPPC